MQLPYNSNENVPLVYTQHDALNVPLEWDTDSEIITKPWPFVHFPQAILRPTTALALFPRLTRQINQTDNESRACVQAKAVTFGELNTFWNHHCSLIMTLCRTLWWAHREAVWALSHAKERGEERKHKRRMVNETWADGLGRSVQFGVMSEQFL